MNRKIIKLARMLAKFETVTTVDGLTMELPNGLNVDSEVFVENEEGELVPIQDGEYHVTDVTIVVVGGVIAEIKQADINEPETVVTEMQEEPTEEPETNAEVEELKAKIAELEQEKAELEAKIEELEAKLSEPIEEPIEDVFKSVEPKKEDKIDFTKYIRNK